MKCIRDLPIKVLSTQNRSCVFVYVKGKSKCCKKFENKEIEFFGFSFRRQTSNLHKLIAKDEKLVNEIWQRSPISSIRHGLQTCQNWLINQYSSKSVRLSNTHIEHAESKRVEKVNKNVVVT